MKGYIYLITHKESKKPYIGQTLNFSKRMREHKNSKCKSSYIDNAIKAHGYEAFEFSILEEIDLPTRKEVKLKLDELEISYIEKYQSVSNGYNLKKGGSSSKEEFDKDTITKLSENSKELWNNPDYREKQRKIRNNPEYKKRISESIKAKNYWNNPEYREKQRMKGRIIIPVIYINLDDNKEEEFNSISSLAKNKNLSKSTITRHIKKDGVYLTKTFKIIYKS